MTATVQVLQGTDPEALAERALQKYVAALTQARVQRRGPAGVWLAPTSRAQRGVQRRLVRELDGACWMPHVTTFDGFAEWLLRRAGRPATSISSTVRRLLLRRIVADMLREGQLQHFEPVARRSGFLDVAESFIAELKRDEVWPEDYRRACAQAGVVTQRDRELEEIYQRYQDILQAQRWYDAEGRFWQARSSLAEGACDPLPAWQCIVAVGFADFTRTQHEILEHLSRYAAQLVVTLPWDKSRPEIFEKPKETLRRLRSSFRNLQIEPVPAVEQEPAFRRALREGLFQNPRQWTPSDAVDGLEVVSATGPRSEQAAVVRRIKSLMAGGASPGSIVVGLRSLATDGTGWERALRDAGLPVWCEVGPPLKEQGLVKFLVGVLNAECSDWEFHRLLAVLDSNCFAPSIDGCDVPAAVRAASAALRRLQLPKQRAVILEALARVAARDSADAAGDEARVPLERLASRALPLLRWYAWATRALSQPRSLSDWMDVMAELVRVFRAAETPERRDLWERLQRTLRTAAAAEAQACETPLRLNVAEFLEEFRDLMSGERLDPPPENPGCIRVLSFDQLRHVSAPYLFLAVLTEDSFPRRRGDDCLFTDSERERLARQQGLSLLYQVRHQQEELLFFQSLVLRAERRLTLSYPDVDVSGRQVFPSPYVSALRMVFTDALAAPSSEGGLDPLPLPDRVFTREDVRLMAMDAALSGHAGWLRTLGEAPATRAMVQNLRAAVEAAVHRFRTRGVTAYEGRLHAADNLRSLSEQYGPGRQFTATELEEYAACPFRFWLQRVLHLEPLKEPVQETDVVGRGSLVHDVLAELLSPMTAGISPAELTDRFRTLVGERLERQPSRTELQRALNNIERQLLDEWAVQYATQFQEYDRKVRSAWDGDWTAAPPELAFGEVRRTLRETQAERYPPLELGQEPNRVLLCGQIDRIDFGWSNSRPVFTVIDYKTGQRPRFSQDDVASGKALQLALYTLAVQQLGIAPGDAAPFQLGYWCLCETGFKAAGPPADKKQEYGPIDRAAWDALVQILEDTVTRLASGIRAGEFVFASDEKECERCSYRTVCRVGQWRPTAERLDKLPRRFTPIANDAGVAP